MRVYLLKADGLHNFVDFDCMEWNIFFKENDENNYLYNIKFYQKFKISHLRTNNTQMKGNMAEKSYFQLYI